MSITTSDWSEWSPRTLLGVLRLSSPALPVGSFSYSEGLESGVGLGWVHDEASALSWIGDAFELAMVRCDWPLVDRLMAAWLSSDWAAIAHWNQHYLITRETHELRAQTLQMGHAMLKWLDNHPCVDPQARKILDLHQTCWPVAFTLAQAQFETPVSLVRLSLAMSWVDSQAQSAMKAIPLGQQSGQRLVQAMTLRIEEAHAQYEQQVRAPEPISFSPGWALLSSQHEHQYTRIFRS